MKKYNFNLETVLSVRSNLEKLWEAKLGRANSECQIVQNRIDLLNKKLDESKSGEINVHTLQVKLQYEERLKYEITKERNLLALKEKERDEIKETYLEKSIDRKIIDKLKDKSLSKYKKELIKDENLTIDEMNNSTKIREAILGGTV